MTTAADKCVFALGYLQAISDRWYLGLELSTVEKTDRSVIGAAKDVIGLIKKNLKKMDEEGDPYDEGEYSYKCMMSGTIDLVQDLINKFQTI